MVSLGNGFWKGEIVFAMLIEMKRFGNPAKLGNGSPQGCWVPSTL
jgi:hypothetical protein